MAARKRKVTLYEVKRRRAQALKKHAAKLRIVKRAADKARRAAARVERDAYHFAPDLIVAVAIDLTNQRVMIKEVEGSIDTFRTGESFKASLTHLAHKFQLIERMEKGYGLGRDCPHPQFARKIKRYCVGTDQGVECWKQAKFCTRCGLIIGPRDLDGPLRASLQEIVMKQAKFPAVRRSE